MPTKIDGKELMVVRNGKPTFAVNVINNDRNNNANYVFVENGDVKFASSWLDSIQPFEVGNESHRLAKQAFTIGIQAAIQIRMLELKQLESIFNDIGMSDCLGSVIVDNAKMLETKMRDVALEVVEQQVEENVRPLALKPKKPKPQPTESE